MPILEPAEKAGYDAHVANVAGNPHGTTAAHVGAVANPMVDAAAPAPPAAGRLLLQSFNQQGFSMPHVYDSAGNAIELTRDCIVIVKNTSGAPITKGRVVRITGASGSIATVALAKADSVATLPAVGIMYETTADGSFGRMMLIGVLENFDLSAFANGALLYVSDTVAGALTATPPALAQSMGSVLNNGVGNGALQVFARVVDRRSNSLSLDASDALMATTNGATVLAIETAVNKVNVRSVQFASGSKTYASWGFVMPNDWDGTTFSVAPVWAANVAGAGNVIWGFQALCLADGDPLDAAFGAAVELTDASAGLLVANHPAHVVVTPAGSAAPGKKTIVRVYRLGTGLDTLAGAALLLSVHVQYNRA